MLSCIMTWVLLLSDSERKKFKDKFFNAEQELAAAKGREQMLQEQLRKEIDFAQEHVRKQIQSFSELEVWWLVLV